MREKKKKGKREKKKSDVKLHVHDDTPIKEWEEKGQGEEVERNDTNGEREEGRKKRGREKERKKELSEGGKKETRVKNRKEGMEQNRIDQKFKAFTSRQISLSLSLTHFFFFLSRSLSFLLLLTFPHLESKKRERKNFVRVLETRSKIRRT